MKYILVFLLILPSSWAFTQPAPSSNNLLDQDPVFRKILSRQLSYPVLNAEKGFTKLVYAEFRIDEEGHVQNIIIMNSAFKIYYDDFDKIVEKALKRLPPLNPLYSAQYILPVMFILSDGQTGKTVIPTNTNFDGILSGRLLLKSVAVTGIRAYKRITEPSDNNYYLRPRAIF
jgi:hypothetical protein